MSARITGLLLILVLVPLASLAGERPAAPPEIPPGAAEFVPPDQRPVPDVPGPSIGPKDGVHGDGGWCPTSEPFVDWLRRRDRQARRPGARLAAREHGASPLVLHRDGMFVIEDDGTVLAHDNPLDLVGSTVEISPSPGGGWRTEVLPLAWDEGDPGVSLFQDRRGWHVEPVELTTFAFPFGGMDRTSLQVTSTTMIAFEDPAAPGSSQLLTPQVLADRTPRLAPLQFGTSLFGRDAWLREEADRAVFTWSADGGNTLDVQAVLYADGRIRFHYRTAGWPEHGVAVVVDGNETWWSDLASAGEITDETGEVEVPAPDGPSLDLASFRAFQVGGSELVQLEIDVAQEPPAQTDGSLWWILELRDEEGQDPFRTIWLAWEDGRWTYTTEAVELDAATLRLGLLATDMPLADEDFFVSLNTWQNTGNWTWADGLTLPVNFPATPVPLNRDLSVEAPFTTEAPLFEAFTLPSLLPYAVHALLRNHMRAPLFDGVAIYQSFKTDLKFFAGGYSTVGNAGADGIGTGSSSDPLSPGLMHLDQIRTGWNGSDSGKVTLLNHEFGHHWLYFFNIEENGERSNILNPGGGHPAGWVHTPAAAPVYDASDASCMGGSRWTDNGDGTFTAPDRFASYGYSWHELYLMGLADPAEVPDWWYIANPDPGLPSAYWPGAGATVSGERVPVSMDQLLAIHGPRSPAYGEAPTDFQVPLVLVVRPGGWTDDDVAELVHTCNIWAPAFSEATAGRGAVRCAYNPPDSVIRTPIVPPVLQVGGSLSFLGEGSDPDGDAFELEWGFDGAAPSRQGPGPHQVTFTQGGIYEVSLTAVDETGLADPTPATLEVTVLCDDPVEAVEGLRIAWEGDDLRMTWDDVAAAVDDYVVLASEVVSGPFGAVEAAPSGDPGVLRAPAAARLRFYQVAARNLPDCLGPY